MTQSTEHGPLLPRPGLPAARRVPAAGVGLLAGAVAAALGLGAVTVVVLLLWVATPYPDSSGPGGALRIAADLWLLAHGATLVREETRSGAPAPVGLTPLLLGALPAWLLYRAARHALEQAGAEGADSPAADGLHGPGNGRPRVRGIGPVLDRAGGQAARRAIGWLCGGYLAVGAVAVTHASGGPLRVDPLSAVLHVPLIAVAAASVGVWSAYGRPLLSVPLPLRRPALRLPVSLRPLLLGPRLLAAGRAAAAATAALVGCGALLVAASLAWHGADVRQSFLALSHPWPGRLAVLLLALVLLPNAAVWAASYGLGAGFALGESCTVGLLRAANCPTPVDLPLLAAVPQDGRGGPLVWGAVTVPVAAGITLGWFTARSAVDRPESAGSRRGIALTALLGALGCGLATACLARWAGGPLGRGSLSRFGPDALAMGAAAAAATALVGVASALVLRAWWPADGPARRRTRFGAGKEAAAGPGVFLPRTGPGREPGDRPDPGGESWSVWEVGTRHHPDGFRAGAAEPWWRLWERRPADRPSRRRRPSPMAPVMPEPRTSGEAPPAGSAGRPRGRGRPIGAWRRVARPRRVTRLPGLARKRAARSHRVTRLPGLVRETAARWLRALRGPRRRR